MILNNLEIQPSIGIHKFLSKAFGDSHDKMNERLKMKILCSFKIKAFI